jgi:hypothetical protein
MPVRSMYMYLSLLAIFKCYPKFKENRFNGMKVLAKVMSGYCFKRPSTKSINHEEKNTIIRRSTSVTF